MALARHAIKTAGTVGFSNKTATFVLYRTILKELPRVLVLYDIDMPLQDAKKAMEYHFRKFAHVQDERAKSVLLAKGYMELEETLMQWKQQSHVLRLLEPQALRPDMTQGLNLLEKLSLGVNRDNIHRAVV